ncbi:helicase [Ectothiorhodospira shaposhnikovii]|uniref:RecQ family ATP-dependent DNA helicase n=1 Tax=Ectothiorhodospira shaposhnikovii TaxID=1054 RepID=UPI001907E52A|nr:RecQ family ATP-dependent DNA helicase [Ectothiorhodospira shaposhnikovii]MBK1672065.1 helicase [Ectothiorhodospira shaposhnikovii]
MAQTPQPKCLIFDLETVPRKGGDGPEIIKIGALRPDTGATLEVNTGPRLEASLAQLEAMCDGASFVLGHNIQAHDIPLLQAVAPDSGLMQLPVIDTLYLSPLAFPQNPYHRLIKDYKLIRDSLNSPLADCRSTLTLFGDQKVAFERLYEVNAEELRCYQALIAPQPGPGLGNFLFSLTRQAPMSIESVARCLPSLLAETDGGLGRELKVCRVRLTALMEQDLRRQECHCPIAYVLAWLRVSGGNSVLAPWVRHQFPAVGQLIAQLRDQPCDDPACSYCRTTHDPRRVLRHYFGFDDFRNEAPGQSMQHDIVLAGMRGQSVLAVLATGGGKSLCYQLPALNRYHRNGSLTVIVSPLQSLMKDQVDGLLGRNVQCAAALNGLLTMPERSDVLEKIQLGDVGMLLVSPEQFRNTAFRKAIANRQVGAWIFDEAHCFSKWGNDFRPDYLYVARFIREFTGDGELAPIGCFTATAKLDVLDDIRKHFLDELGVRFTSFIGTPERPNLYFEVLPVQAGEKFALTHQLLTDELEGHDGGAVVFVSSRKRAETLADFLIGQDWTCKSFHAGLQPHEKKDIQESFIRGHLRVIVATNAFGMGVDKSDVRLVIHADIPGSLENYLQEAGRAGRDQARARCVLLYNPRDIETQFGLSERSRLGYKDIQQILKKLRHEAARRKGGLVVITAGEILQDEGVHTSFEADDRDAETKVITAIAWLERRQFLRREENHTRVFPARLCLTEEEAEKRLCDAQLPQRRLAEFRAILRYLYSAAADERIDTDRLMMLTGQTNEEVSGALRQLEALGLLENDSQLTLYLRHGVAGASSERLRNAFALEKGVFKALRELAPDGDDGSWQDLNLPSLTTMLRERCDQPDLLPLHVTRLLHSLALDRDGDSQQRSNFELKQFNRDHLKLRIRGGYRWSQIEGLGERRHRVASVLLPFVLAKLPPGQRGKDLLVQTTFGELMRLFTDDLELAATIKPEQRRKAIEHVLLYLHNQEVLTLNHGMTVMRRAMTIVINPEKQGQRYLKDDYRWLDEHYRERRIQVHVMREYAEVALKEMADALRLVMHYFTQTKEDFLRKYFEGKDEILSLSTSESSWKAITDTLNATQKAIVTDHQDHNRLVLAGPGSGKTRLVVHRIAYLLRVRRVPATAIIALTFNRHAANEIRQRLLALVGNDAIGLTVLTYHAMAMRLTGSSFDRRDTVEAGELEAILDRAADLLEGCACVEGEDDLRERLLQGYRYILVDEYQDIDERQYRLVSALSRRHEDHDGDLCILAVGDDDQNIYQWRGGSNRHIESFCKEYGAKVSYLVENYRSSGAIILAANRLIGANASRLKAEHPIRINQARADEPAGGKWEGMDAQRHGRVLRITLPVSDRLCGNLQAQAAIAELARLQALERRSDWRGLAVLARSHRYLWPVQALCERNGIACFMAADKQGALPLVRLRPFVALVDHLRAVTEPWLTAAALGDRVRTLTFDPVWGRFFDTAFEQLVGEYGDCQLAPSTVIDWLYNYAREIRQQVRPGLFLGTVHSAKGLEFRHVVLLDGCWDVSREQMEEARRLYYVGMTRAEQTLTLCDFGPGNPFTASLGECVRSFRFEGRHDPTLDVRYQTLALGDVDIGFAGRQGPDAPVHEAIRRLEPGDPLQWCPDGDRYALLDRHGQQVGRTAKAFHRLFDPEACEVAGIVTRYREDSGQVFRAMTQCTQWEVVVPRFRGRASERPLVGERE